MAKATTYSGQTKHTSDQKLWEYVTVPEQDIFGNENQGFFINHDRFLPGVYFVPPEIASEMKRIIRVAMDADIRLMQPKKHLKSLLEAGLQRVTPGGVSNVETNENSELV